MSISSTATKVTYSGNNSTVTPYPISFKYLEDAHVNVYIDGVLQVEGAGQNYVLAGDGTAGTGTFTTTVAQAGTKSVVVVLDVALDQPVSLQETGSLPAKTLEQAYDRLNMQIRRVWRKAQDVLTFSSDEANGSTGTADNLLGFDSSGDIAEIPNTTFLQQDNNLSELANAPDQAAAQTNLNVDPAGTDNSTDVTKTGAGTYISLAGQVLTVDEITETDLNASINASLDKADTAVQVANNLSDVTAATARTNLGVDPAGTDNSTDVTKVGTGTYVSLAGQVLTVDEIDEADLNASINASLDLADTSIQSLASIEGNSLLSTGATVGQVLQSDGDTTCSFIDLVGGGNAQTANPLSQFAATTSAELAGVISDETGTGALVFATSPTLVTPALGTPSAVDLTNATNYPETNGTVQGSDNLRQIILADASNAVTPNARAVNSIDLQPVSALATQIPSTDGAVLLGGLNNTADGVRATCISGTLNISSGANAIIAGGYSNTATGDQSGVYSGYTNQANGTASAVVGGNNNIATGTESLVAGGQAGTATNVGARVFPDSTTTAITTRQQDEFTIQASALRLEDGNEAVGKVLTCNHVDGSSNWAATTVFDVRNYGTVGDGTTDDGVAIQAAITAAEASLTTNISYYVDGAAMPVVDLAGGVYGISETNNLVVGGRIRFQNGTLNAVGAGWTTGAVLVLSNNSDGAIADGINIDGGITADGLDGEAISAISSRGVGNIIQNCSITHFKDSGIRLWTGNSQVIRNCIIAKWNSADTNYALASSRTGSGIQLNSDQNRITNCTIIDCGKSVDIQSGSALSVHTGCRFWSQDITTPVGGEGQVDVSHIRNFFTNCYFDGVRVTIADTKHENNFAGCVFIDGQETEAIYVDTTATADTVDALTVMGCLFDSNYTAAITFNGSGTYADDIDKNIQWVGNRNESGATVWYGAKFGAGNQITGGVIGIADGVTAPSTVTGVAQLYVDTADGDLKVKFGNGTVVVLAAD